MDGLNRIVSYQVANYGGVKVKLAEALARRGITRNHLHTLTGVKYDVIERYYQGSGVQRVDLDVLAKFCYALNCRIEDLLEYQPPEE